MNENGKVIAALLAGAAVGAIAGLLFAPDKGENTRKKVVDEANKLADSIKNSQEHGLEELKAKANKGLESLSAAGSKVAEQLDHLKQQATDKINELAGTIKSDKSAQNV